MRLSKRLALVASSVDEGSNLVDVGAGHGYIPIALTRQGKVTRATTMDMKKEPLEQARKYIREYHLGRRIETRLSDGAERLKAGEAGTIVIAGTDGGLVIHIPEGDCHLWGKVGQWMSPPQSELDRARTYLQENGFVITKEDMVEEDRKYCIVMDVSRDIIEEMSQAERLYKAYLIRHRDPVLRESLKRERNQLLKIREQLNTQSMDSARARLAEPAKELNWNRETQDEVQ